MFDGDLKYGFDLIVDTDKTNIVQLIEKGNTSRNLPQPKVLSSKQIGIMKSPPNIRRSQLKSSSLPAINVMYTNADQLTLLKMTELKKLIQREKPLIIAVCKLKPINNKKRTLQDYEIPGYSFQPVNLESHIGRGFAVYTHSSRDQSVVQIEPMLDFEEMCLLDIIIIEIYFKPERGLHTNIIWWIIIVVHKQSRS